MLSAHQLEYFNGFKNFTPDPTAPVEQEFQRIRDKRGWVIGGTRYKKEFLKLFQREYGTHPQDGHWATSNAQSQGVNGFTKADSEIDTLANTLQATNLADGGNNQESDNESDGGAPLRYFTKIDGFQPDHSRPIREEFDRFAQAKGWKKQSREYQEGLHDAVITEFKYWTSRDVKRTVMQRLCEDLGIDPVPGSVTQCKKALEKVYVNIFTYVDCKRAGKAVKPVFNTYMPFRRYTLDGKIFPKVSAKADLALRCLLKDLHMT